MQCRPSNFVLISNDGEAASADTPRARWQDSFPPTYRRWQEESQLVRLQEQDKAQLRAQKNRARLDRLPEGDQRQVHPYVEYLQRERAQEREAVRERCENRREFPARKLASTGPLGGLWREGFTISGFASDQHVLFRLMITRLPGGGRGLVSGNNKEWLSWQNSKLLALDDLYIESCKAMQGVFRKDIDQVFPSIPALKASILACDAPLPNLIVGDIDTEGRVHRPHLYYLLADAVCFKGKGRRGPQALFGAVCRGLTKLLLPIGADPGGDSNSTRGKNPLSPGWDRVVCVEVPYQLTGGPKSYPDLPTLRQYADFSVTRDELHRRAAEQAGTSVLQDGRAISSNAHFNLLRRFAWTIVKLYCDDGQAGVERFAEAVTAYAREIASRCGISDEEENIERRAHYVWTWVWDNALARRGASRPNRGCLKEATEGKTRREAQALGGQHSALHKKGGKQETFEKLRDALQALRADGRIQAEEMPTNAVLAGAAGVNKRTVPRHRDALAEVLRGGDRRSYDKKGTSLPSCTPSSAPTPPLQLEKVKETPAERYARIRPTLDDQTPHDLRLIFRSPGPIIPLDPTKPFPCPSGGSKLATPPWGEPEFLDAIMDFLCGKKPAAEPAPWTPEPLVSCSWEEILAMREQRMGRVPGASPAQQAALGDPNQI